MRIAVAGNCQANVIKCCAEVMVPGLVGDFIHHRTLTEEPESARERLVSADLVISGDGGIGVAVNRLLEGTGQKVFVVPAIFFMGYHPDLIFPPTHGPRNVLPTQNCHSALVLQGFLSGLTQEETKSLFDGDVFERVGYYDYWHASCQTFLEQAQSHGYDLTRDILDWKRQGVFMYNPLHPKMLVLGGLAKKVLEAAGHKVGVTNPEELMADPLQGHVIWPVYPDIAKRLGVPGSYNFKLHPSQNKPGERVRIIGLDEFIDASYSAYSEHPRESLHFARLDDQRYLAVAEAAKARGRGSPSASGNPYKALPDVQFWRRAVGNVEPSQVDPVSGAKFALNEQTRLATAGSCFAQNIARTLARSGFNFYITEAAPGTLSEAEATAANYGVYSARYGNIYTVRQLLQTFDRAFGRARPCAESWQREDGRFIDPFRPEILQGGFKSFEELYQSQVEHLAAVRRMFETLDVFVFTLGLTEAWQDVRDGMVVPIAPGVVGAVGTGRMFTFVNFTTSEVRADLELFIDRLHVVNPAARIILTVSPVSLVATYERRHVLTSTVYSKSVLRAVAGECADSHPQVDYFPSYEVITGAFNRGRYFEDDLRSVSAQGVEHVMTLFMKHYTRDRSAPSAVGEVSSRKNDVEADRRINREISLGRAIICEEELLDR